jgi:ubiquinone/menaquinone biosynthesis C-methylase UbiE
MDSARHTIRMGPQSAHCRHNVTEPAVSVQEFFDRTADYWDTLYQGGTFIHRHMRDRKEIVLAEVERIAHGRQLAVLDLGCGTGILTRSLLEKGHHVASVDCSQNMLARLRESADGPLGERFLGAFQAGVCDTPFQNERFDLVLCIGVIQYQQDEDDVLKEIVRVVKTGGYCVFTVPNLLTVAHLTDPLYGLRLVKRLWTRLVAEVEPRAGLHGAFRVVGDHGGTEPYNKKYLKWEIISALERHRLRLRQETGYGFEPLPFAGRECLPDCISISLSNTVTSITQLPRMKWLSHFANRWVFVVQKL